MERFFQEIDRFLHRQMSRRNFLRTCLFAVVAFISQNIILKLAFARTPLSERRRKKMHHGRRTKGDYDLVLAEGSDPYENTVKAVKAMGGMERFVKRGATVVIKPNMSWDRTPEQAGNTNPMVVAALVALCYEAGAKRVNVFDNTCAEPRRSYENSGVAEAAREKGAYVYFPDSWNVVKMHFSYKSPMEGWPVFKDAVKCDTFINVPILKHHGLTGLTLSMKNLMGICSGTRGLIHANIGRKLADLTDFISPDLTIIDAHRVLVRHGPSGGDLKDVAVMNKLIAATDPVLADAYASTLMNRDPMSISYIKEGTELKYGSPDISKARIQKI